MKYEILKDGKIIDRIEAPDADVAFNDAMELFDGELDDVREIKTKSPEEIKARGEEAYNQMNKQIRSDRSKELKQAYDYLYGNPVTEFVSGMVMPSTVEAINMGIEPSWGEAAIDAGLAATTLIPPLKGATMWGNVGKNALLGAGIADAGEGAMAKLHDREYNLLAPVVGAVGGGVIGGISGTVRNRAIQQIMNNDPNITPEQAVQIFENNIKLSFGGGDVTEASANKMYEQARNTLASPENVELVKARNAERVAKSAGKDIKVVDLGENKARYIKDSYEPIIKANLTKSSRKAQESVLNEALDDIKANSNPLTGLPDLDIVTSIVERYQNTDPTLARLLTDVYITPEFARWKQKGLPAPTYESMKTILGRKGIPEEFVEFNVPESARKAAPITTKLVAPDVAEKAVEDISMANAALRAPKSVIMPKKIPDVSMATAKKVTKLPSPSAGAVSYPSTVSTQTTDKDGNLLYAPRGRITWEQLFSEAPRSK